MLYDEWDKLLETRFVKKDDLMLSGETVTFGSYLVDLGEPCQGHRSTSGLNSQDKDEKLTKTSSLFYSYSSQNRKPMLGKRKGRVLNISPSQNVIRDFKRSEMNKFRSSPNCMDVTNLSTKDQEWQVLYTTQLTQKAKKFHDGFLQLIVCGSQGRQVKLYDTNRRQLDGRFLKKDEIVSSGESLQLDGHLVEIGEQEGDQKLPTDLNIQGKNFKVVGESGMVDCQAKIPNNKKNPAGKAPGDTSQERFTLSDSSHKTENARLSLGHAEPRRSVRDILSILRQPIERKDNPQNKSFTEHCKESLSTEFQSEAKNHINEYTEECSATARKELRDNGLEHDSILKAVKTEPVQSIIEAEECVVSENGRVPQASSSSSHPSGHNQIECCSSKPSTKLPELQQDKNGSSFTCKSDCTSLSGLNGRSLKQGLDTEDMDDYPSFDLGF